MYEKLFLDTVIDRFYVKMRHRLEPYNLINSIHESVNTVFTYQNIPKTYVKERIFKILQYQDQLSKLMAIPKLEQRSQEWYDIRKNLITASDFAQALGDGKFGTQKQLLIKKSGYEKDTFDNNMPALKWGVKYEPVAIEAYAKKNNVTMHEFGLLIHPQPSMKWFGASPDSISELGIMVEIKCPWRRKITGEVPLQYFYQVQGQLDVCGLNECDFLECEFIEYDNENEFCRHFDDNPNERGIIIEYQDDKQQTQYSYSPFKYCDNCPKTIEWYKNTLTEMQSSNIVKTYFWQLHTYSVVRIYKDEVFLKDKFPQLHQIWQKIMDYKNDKGLYEKEIIGSIVQQPITLNIDIDTSVKSEYMKKKETKNNKEIQLTGWAFVSDDED
jgi:putative phage-type endonuclease